MLGIVFPIVLAIICALVLERTIRHKSAYPFIIAYWIVLLMKNLGDLLWAVIVILVGLLSFMVKRDVDLVATSRVWPINICGIRLLVSSAIRIVLMTPVIFMLIILIGIRNFMVIWAMKKLPEVLRDVLLALNSIFFMMMKISSMLVMVWMGSIPIASAETF